LLTKKLPFVVVAKKQMSGRGRMQRTWFSKEGASICMSVCADMHGVSSDLLASATVRVGIEVCKTLSEICKKPLFLKWPNDIYTQDGRKIAGMLAELAQAGNGYNIVFGIGINYDFSDVLEIPSEISDKVADIRSILKTDKSIANIISVATKAIVNALSQKDLSSLSEFEKFDWLFNKNVDVVVGAENFSGVAQGINEFGNLLVQLPDNSIKIVNSGEATFHK
jgi:BirA family biotin operon repressor/biotin-[acetyl-CoA-carboxylase] ligase